MSKYFGTPFANTGDQTSIPDASQPSGEVSFEDGYTPDYSKDQATDPTAKDVPRQSENYFKFVVTDAIKELQEYGFKLYDALVNYPVNSRTIGADGRIYKALIINGPDTSVVDPVGNPATWEKDMQAVDVDYDNTASGLTSINAQDAIDEVSVQAGGSPIMSVDASVLGSAITLSLNAVSLDFRDTDTTSGSPVNVTTDGVSLAVSSGSTLGTIGATKSKIVIIAINNAGTIELACINIAGGVNLDETTLIDTVAEGGAGGADLDNVFYSTTARSGVAFRVVGFVESTQTVAGAWDTAPSLVQGAGGQAIAAMASLGYGQSWVDVLGSRVSGVTYYNTTGKPIVANLSFSIDLAEEGIFYINGIEVTKVARNNSGSDMFSTTNIIPPGSSYYATVSTNGFIDGWVELR